MTTVATPKVFPPSDDLATSVESPWPRPLVALVKTSRGPVVESNVAYTWSFDPKAMDWFTCGYPLALNCWQGGLTNAGGAFSAVTAQVEPPSKVTWTSHCEVTKFWSKSTRWRASAGSTATPGMSAPRKGSSSAGPTRVLAVTLPAPDAPDAGRGAAATRSRAPATRSPPVRMRPVVTIE